MPEAFPPPSKHSPLDPDRHQYTLLLATKEVIKKLAADHCVSGRQLGPYVSHSAYHMQTYSMKPCCVMLQGGSPKAATTGEKMLLNDAGLSSQCFK